MNEKTKIRVEKAKAYVRENAAPVITAVAAVGSLVALSRMKKDVHHVRNITQQDLEGRMRSADVMQDCFEQNRKFEYQPGVGVLIYPAGHKLFESKD